MKIKKYFFDRYYALQLSTHNVVGIVVETHTSEYLFRQ